MKPYKILKTDKLTKPDKLEVFVSEKKSLKLPIIFVPKSQSIPKNKKFTVTLE